MTGELTQAVPCPVCGWENGLLDSADGLHAVQRKCGNSTCRVSFVAVYRGYELVGTQRLLGHDVTAYRRTLSLIHSLTEHEVETLVHQAQERADRRPFREAVSG